MSATKGSTSKRKFVDENRKFQESWTERYFFVNDGDKIICLVCGCTVAVAKEYNVKRHYEGLHKGLGAVKGEERVKKIAQLKKSLTSQQQLFVTKSKELDLSVEVSLNIAAIIAKSGRPFTDGEFAKQCLLSAAEKLAPDAVTKFKNVSLSRMTMQRRIVQLAADVENQLQQVVSCFSYFSLAADESTDITSTAQLLVFVRGVSSDFNVTEELLGMTSMKGTTTGTDILHAVLEQCSAAKLDMKKLISVTTDGAPSMVGKNNGFVALLKEHLGSREEELLQYHCIIHQQQLCAKELGFDTLMKVVTEAINFIRSHSLHHRQFKEILNELDEYDHNDLLYYTEIRWLSRGAALKRFVELLDPVLQFMEEKGRSTKRLKDPRFQCDLGFLTDITGHLNDLNKKLQGKKQYISDMSNSIDSFKTKLSLFSSQLQNENFAHFECCRKMKEKYPSIKMDYSDQINALINVFNNRCKDFEQQKTKFQIFRNPFSVAAETAPETFQLELIDLQSSDSLKCSFKESDLMAFYRLLSADTFHCLKKNALICASMFGSTYLCEQTFSVMNNNKSRLRSRLTDENLQSVLRVAVSSFEPNIAHIATHIQSQASH